MKWRDFNLWGALAMFILSNANIFVFHRYGMAAGEFIVMTFGLFNECITLLEAIRDGKK